MAVFSGNTSTTSTYTVSGTPVNTIYFSVVNKTGSTATVNVYINNGSSNIDIIPKDMQLGAGESLISNDTIELLAGYSVTVSTNQSSDYYFVFG